MRQYSGVLDYYFETGTEGVMWSLMEDGKQGYDALVLLQPGDRLTIYNADGSVLFNDVIKIDDETGYMPYPGNPQYGQQAALGYWIHWIQEGWQPDNWAALFFRGEHFPDRPDRLRAELVRQ